MSKHWVKCALLGCDAETLVSVNKTSITYCGRDHANEARLSSDNVIIRYCVRCGEKFPFSKSKIRDGKGQYCTTHCALVSLNEARWGERKSVVC